MFFQDLFIALIHGISLLALLAICFGQVERQYWPQGLRSVVQGLIFGCGGIIAMMAPARIGDGIMVDSRALIVAFAAAFGGWPAALVAVVISGSYRLWLGGLGAMPGAAGIAVAALLGLGWRYFLRPKTRIKARHLVVLGLVVSCYLFTGIAMGYSTLAILIGMIAPYMVAASVFASVLLGLFVDRELNQIDREQAWKTRALTDPLTTLPNRRAFERGIAGLRLDNKESALLILDLDHFKLVNDSHGHAAGDYVLQQVSMILRANMRNRDLLSRLGGEELAVLLPDTGAIKAQEIAERLRASIEALDIHWEGQTIKITASFGVAVAPGVMPSNELFVQADAALYAAKRSGRNRVVMSGEVLLRPAMGIGSVQAPAVIEKPAPGRAA
ncbi:diguanylate cyclase [Devosia sp. YR412]|uniref:GGDEF domain-containing protein n=1 Tax=Devosia sp. YR412 TaxID=1881030 RepID=UPI0008B5DFD8|nr:diguanylate cyclase [Devosia sp. YR412]SEQ29073.1 diguanylate cyclase [Devosia sp. YR412]